MNRIGLIANADKPDAMKLLEELVRWLLERGVEVLVEKDPAELIGRSAIGFSSEEVASTDMIVVLGGDGTILRASRVAAPRGTPMLGVHFGQYGFITEVHPPEAKEALERVLNGDYHISERIMLRARLIRSGEEVGSWTALNDVVVSKGPLARLLSLHVSVREKYIATYAADGIIVSSPTGSTAYSLSAGGPVVNPSVGVMIITPICPHTLNARSLVVPDDDLVQVTTECGEDESVMLTVDGQLGFYMQSCDRLDVTKAEFSAKIVTWDPLSFYGKLQSRLRWGDRFSS